MSDSGFSEAAKQPVVAARSGSVAPVRETSAAAPESDVRGADSVFSKAVLRWWLWRSRCRRSGVRSACIDRRGTANFSTRTGPFLQPLLGGSYASMNRCRRTSEVLSRVLERPENVASHDRHRKRL